MNTKLFFLGLALGVGLATAGAIFANNVVDARSGNTAALSVATSADGVIVYVVNPNGFFKSGDGGNTWRSMPVN